MARYLGIDPGLGGGFALIETREGAPPAFVSGLRTPVIRHKGKGLVDARELLVWLTDLGRIDQAVIEQVAARPGQGVTSSFTFGRATGAIETLAQLMAETVVWTTPSVWKKDLGLGTEKRDSLDLCRLRFGDAFTFRALSDDGVAEAALLAYHAAGYR
jgi:Holliday junction resolvasome RuvABC endonuclease subunit